MITSYQNYKSNRIRLGYNNQNGRCACHEIWKEFPLYLYGITTGVAGNQEFYYIDPQDVENDIRYVTALYSNALMTQIATPGYYAQIIPEQVSGSQYWWVYWNGISISQVTQADEGDLHSVYQQVTLSNAGYDTDCNIQLRPVYFPSGQTFATSTAMYLDPFGCNFFSGLLYIFNPIGSGSATHTRLWIGSSWHPFDGFTPWQINTGQGLGQNPLAQGAISVNYAIEAIDSVCNPTAMEVWQSCSITSLGFQ